MSISVTEVAAKEIKDIIAAQNLGSDTVLRVAIAGGGCHGMQYSLGFDNQYNPAVDAHYECNGVTVVTGKEYDLFLDDAAIDFIDTPASKGFSVDNPFFPPTMGCPGCSGH
ncbi:MAG: iron-sulfur cluster assembly accessory protein [Planctomycetia bacterium]|nr:iron-sulfur cluster assembly accessory protein [Planctomycetia bacterium]